MFHLCSFCGSCRVSLNTQIRMHPSIHTPIHAYTYTQYTHSKNSQVCLLIGWLDVQVTPVESLAAMWHIPKESEDGCSSEQRGHMLLLTRLRNNLSKWQFNAGDVQILMQYADVDGDGRLTLGEFPGEVFKQKLRRGVAEAEPSTGNHLNRACFTSIAGWVHGSSVEVGTPNKG